MAIILVNKDNTVNYIGEEISDDIVTDGLDIITIEGKSLLEIQNGVPPEHCVYDYNTKMVLDSRKNPHLVKDLLLESLETNEEKEDYQRRMRKKYLRKVDLVLGNKLWFDSLSDDEKRQVYQYRQDLLDITKQKTFPDYVSWPEIPKFIEG